MADSCGQHRSDAGFSLFDLLITPAHAGTTTCLISAGGKTLTFTPDGALTCLVTFQQIEATAITAARAAASTLALTLYFGLDPTTAGAAVDETKKLSDGTLIHVTGQQSEMTRQVSVTLPNGQRTELILTSNGHGGYDLVPGSVLGERMSSSVLAEMANRLFKNGVQIVPKTIVVAAPPQVHRLPETILVRGPPLQMTESRLSAPAKVLRRVIRSIWPSLVTERN